VAQTSGTPESFDLWAVVVFQQDGGWQVGELPPAVAEDLDDIEAAVRGQVLGAFALVDVADEFFVVVRNLGGHLRFLLSDVTASVEWELAAQVMDRLDLDLPADDELDEVWPVGDLGVFDDLGLDAMELGAILSDVDAYADEMLSTLARRLGFAEAYEKVVDALV
jgi:putative tRNA adenosine deaminase-associated protein